MKRFLHFSKIVCSPTSLVVYEVCEFGNESDFLVFDLATLGPRHVDAYSGKHLVSVQYMFEHARVI